MSKLKKTASKQNLHKIQTFINDTSELSQNFFSISQLENELSLGKNGFLVEGTDRLREGSEIKIEILDALGDVVYHEVTSYKEANSRLVSVLVYDSCAAGECTITILGKANRDRGGQEIPKKWLNKYNIKWTKKVHINPDKFNTNPIRFYKKPVLLIGNQNYTKQEQVYDNDNIFYEVGNEFIESYTQHSGYVSKAVGDNRISATYYPQEYGYSYMMMSAHGDMKFTKNMEDQFFVISPSRAEVKSGKTIEEVSSVSERMVCRIQNIISDKNAKFEVISDVWKNYSKKLNIGPTRHFNLVYKAKPRSSENREVRYYSDLEVGNLKTITGECVRAKIYNKRINYSENYKFVSDYEIEPTELFIRSDASRTELIKPAGEFNSRDDFCSATGACTSQPTNINPYITYSENTNITYDQNTLINSIGIGLNNNTQPGGLEADLGVSNYTFFEEAEYSLSFDVAYKGSFKADSTLEVSISGASAVKEKQLTQIKVKNEIYKLKDNKLNFFLSKTADSKNPFVDVINEIERVGLENIENVEDVNWLISYMEDINTIDQLKTYINNTSGAYEELRTGNIGNLKLKFHIKNLSDPSAMWYIKNISVSPAQEMGFGPDYTVLKVPVDTDKYSRQDIDKLQYKIDLFDANNNKAGVYLESDQTYKKK